MRIFLGLALLAFTLSFVLGFVAQSTPPAPRPVDQIAPVPPSWYASLPHEPSVAAGAFLARVPRAMRDRGEAVSDSRYWALLLRVIAGLGAVALFLYSGAARSLDAATVRLSRHRPLQALGFSLTMLVSLFVISLPVEVWASYARYRGFGFSEQPFTGWLQDYFVGWATTALFYAIGLVILILVIRRHPRSWFLWAGCLYLVLASIYVAATPIFIEPLTNTYTPLPESALKHDILNMAKSAGIPAQDIYTADASRQSRRLNAHMSGSFGVARLSIDDTALGSYPPAVKAVAAHEMGHYVMWHPFKMVLVATLVAALGFTIMAGVAPLLLGVYGPRWGIPNFNSNAAIALIWGLFVAWGFVADPLTNAYARVQETQADSFSLNLSRQPMGLAEFMIHDADIGRLFPTAVDLILFYDHPSDAERVQHAMAWRATHPDEK